MFKRSLYGWNTCTPEVYANFYYKFGGSVCVHPRVLNYLRATLGIEINYYNRHNAAYCTFNDSLVYHNPKIPFIFDDLLFPVAPGSKVFMPHKTKRLSPLAQHSYHNGIYSDLLKHKIAYVKEDFSKTTVRKRNAEIRKIKESGGEFKSISGFSAKALSQIYCELFNLRWNGKIKCFDETLLEDVFKELNDLLFGNVLLINNQPAAYDLIYRAESSTWLYFDDINGGVDPNFMNVGAGTALLWQNITEAKMSGSHSKIPTIFSLGIYLKGWEYKKQWCDILSSGRIII
ncbi:antimicrobial resistance protein Mig-14 [Yokenella regensburgei]|uniref:transcriptional regulator n=1 Tax=Yokenella regensburgei TaxID=158877 RepID=UPI003F1497FF